MDGLADFPDAEALQRVLARLARAQAANDIERFRHLATLDLRVDLAKDFVDVDDIAEMEYIIANAAYDAWKLGTVYPHLRPLARRLYGQRRIMLTIARACGVHTLGWLGRQLDGLGKDSA